MPDAVRGSGLALLNTTTGVAKLLSSITFGARFWDVISVMFAFLMIGPHIARGLG